ncbi:MAG: CRISPR-associated endonuclease Cas2 [Eubacteriales bacterium]
MFVLITYDINTQTREGRRRLRKVAKVCVNYGQRVQNSVFECLVDEAQLREIEHRLDGIINKETDSLRYYRLGDNYKRRVKHVGAKETFRMDEPLVL